MQPSLQASELRQFSGGLELFRHSLNRNVIYTPGVQFLAERAQAYWLIDAIASYFDSEIMSKATKRDPRLSSMQFWRLDVKDESGVLTARADDGVAAFVRQEIEFTDFPLAVADIWAGYDGRHWTLYLPSEH